MSRRDTESALQIIGTLRGLVGDYLGYRQGEQDRAERRKMQQAGLDRQVGRDAAEDAYRQSMLEHGRAQLMARPGVVKMLPESQQMAPDQMAGRDAASAQLATMKPQDLAASDAALAGTPGYGKQVNVMDQLQRMTQQTQKALPLPGLSGYGYNGDEAARQHRESLRTLDPSFGTVVTNEGVFNRNNRTGEMSNTGLTKTPAESTSKDRWMLDTKQDGTRVRVNMDTGEERPLSYSKPVADAGKGDALSKRMLLSAKEMEAVEQRMAAFENDVIAGKAQYTPFDQMTSNAAHAQPNGLIGGMVGPLAQNRLNSANPRLAQYQSDVKTYGNALRTATAGRGSDYQQRVDEAISGITTNPDPLQVKARQALRAAVRQGLHEVTQGRPSDTPQTTPKPKGPPKPGEDPEFDAFVARQKP